MAQSPAEVDPMDFPIQELMDEDACYQLILRWLHPAGLACPHCLEDDRMAVHRRYREPILDDCCGHCHRVFNAFTGTPLKGNKRPMAQLVLVLRGFAQGVSTARLARELSCDRSELLALRHRLQGYAHANLPAEPLPDAVVEADEAYRNAGEKRQGPRRPGRPAAAPGQRAARPRHLG